MTNDEIIAEEIAVLPPFQLRRMAALSLAGWTFKFEYTDILQVTVVTKWAVYRHGKRKFGVFADPLQHQINRAYEEEFYVGLAEAIVEARGQ